MAVARAETRGLTGVWVFCAGGVGAALRYLLDGFVQERWNGAFPMGTATVNLLGALLLGLLTGFATAHASLSPSMRSVVGTGLLGAFTTFSTLTYESLRLLREGARRYAVTNLLGTTALGMGLAAIGLALGRNL
jgi:CrcB protein